MTVNRNPSLDNELANKKYIDNEIDKNTIVRFNKTLENYFKISVGKDTYNLTKYNKIQIADTTVRRVGNIGSVVLPYWKCICYNENIICKITNFIKMTKTKSPTGSTAATTLPPIGSAFMYIETPGDNHGQNRVFVSRERTDIIQITNITFYLNRFAILTNDSFKSMGRFRVQILLEDNTWSTRYNIPKNDRHSDSPTHWTLVNLNFTVENYGIKLIFEWIGTPHADKCFSNITITHCVY